MLSADLIPCTLTLPLISLAQLAPARASVILAATAAFAAILNRFIRFLSCSSVFVILFPGVALCLEDVIDSRLKRVGAEEKDIRSSWRRVGLPKSVLVFPDDFYVGAHQHLEAGAEAVSRVISRRRRAIEEVRMRIHSIIVEGSDQPRMNPIVGSKESSGEIHARCACDGKGQPGRNQMVVIVPIHSQAE